MSRPRPHITILCEDKQQQSFIRRFLLDQGWNNSSIRYIPPPDGQGDGKQHVREKYPGELRALRAATKNAALAVMTDGNAVGISERQKQLDAACNAQNIEPRKPADKVVVFIPTRSIETWIAYLGGNSVDETQQYPRLSIERKCKPQVNALAKMCDAGKLRDPAPPSLEAACEEYKKIR